ncbi:MAG TPA: hypothetical protein EYN66_07090 [Myxococcales bacterium]|nr:hypothetical protein [Myxococcales bacterium]
MKRQVPILFLLFCVAGCTPDAPKHQGLPSTYRSGFERPDNSHVLVPGTNPAVSLVSISGQLGCDLPCSKKLVDTQGECVSGIALRCEAGRIVCDECWSVSKTCVQDGEQPV